MSFNHVYGSWSFNSIKKGNRKCTVTGGPLPYLPFISPRGENPLTWHKKGELEKNLFKSKWGILLKISCFRCEINKVKRSRKVCHTKSVTPFVA